MLIVIFVSVYLLRTYMYSKYIWDDIDSITKNIKLIKNMYIYIYII